MRSFASFFALLLSLGPVAAVAQPSDVFPPQRRTPSVEMAGRLARPPEAPVLPAELKNPFAPAALPSIAATVTEPARSGSLPTRQLLEAMAPSINPTGTMSLNGELILLFGQKRIKVGGSLPITFDGQPYVLVISAIQRNSFTLRLDGEETTRPIKPANRP